MKFRNKLLLTLALTFALFSLAPAEEFDKDLVVHVRSEAPNHNGADHGQASGDHPKGAIVQWGWRIGGVDYWNPTERLDPDTLTIYFDVQYQTPTTMIWRCLGFIEQSWSGIWPPHTAVQETRHSATA